MAEPSGLGGGRYRRGRAARWVARMGSDRRVVADEAALKGWLAEHPENREAYVGQAQLWNAIGSLADNPDARALLLGEAGRPVEAMVDDDPPAPVIRIVPGGTGRRTVIHWLAAACAVSLVGGMVFTGGHGDRYATAPGEQRHVKLTDGSVVTLDTASAVEVRLSKAERRLVLQSGQAFFEVARDTARPFRVFVGNSEVRALGTGFSVRKEGAGALVFLAHGMVSVREADAAAVILKPGQQARLVPSAAVAVAKVDPERVQAWRHGRLMFDATPLAVAVTEVNRYGGRPILLSEPALGRIRISGVFHTRQPEAFVETVTAIFPVRMIRNGDEQAIILASRN